MPRPAVIRRRSLRKVSLYQRIINKVDRHWSAYKLARTKERYRRQIGRTPRRRPAFVFGCQRSGTNMTLRTLDCSMQVDKVEETDQRGFIDVRLRSKEECDRVIAASTADCVLFKPITDSHRAREILDLYPNSRAIWIFRRFEDVANSAIEYWGEQSRVWLEDLLAGDGDWRFAQWIREGISDECLEEVRQACSEGCNDHAACCVFWYMRNRTFFEQGLDTDPRVLLLCYEEAVRNPRPAYERMCGFLDIEFSREVIAGVEASSVRKRPFPSIGPRVRALCEGLHERLMDAWRKQWES